jgi:hypothetical protein
MWKIIEWFKRPKQNDGENKMDKKTEKKLDHLVSRLATISDKIVVMEKDLDGFKLRVERDMNFFKKNVEKDFADIIKYLKKNKEKK